MFKKFVYIIVTIIFIFLLFGLFLPSNVHVERSIVVNRPASTVFFLLNGYRTYNSWSPWARRDPDTVYAYSGPDYGVGARMSWNGDPRLVGSGWQEIVDSQPYTLIRTQLSFDQQGRADAYFQIVPAGSEVRLTWGFDTDLLEGQGVFGGLLAKYFGLFFDRWIGSDYEEGLTRFKEFAESLPGADFSGLQAEIVEVEPMDILFISSGSSQDPGDIAESLNRAHGEILEFMQARGIRKAGPAMAITRAWDEEGYRFDAAIPVKNLPEELAGHVQAGRSPSGRAVQVVHKGPYEQMAPAYEMLSAYMAAHGLTEGPVSWELYVSDPAETPEQELITHIYFLVGN